MAWKIPSLARVANGWSMNTDTMGVYGNYYLKRDIVAQLGLGANLPEDAIYPINLFDSTHQPLDGAHKYTIHRLRGHVRCRIVRIPRARRALGLTAMAGETLADARTGKNGRHTLVGLLRQSVFGRLAGYEDVMSA